MVAMDAIGNSGSIWRSSYRIGATTDEGAFDVLTRTVMREYGVARQLVRFRLIRVVRIRERLVVAERSPIESKDISAGLLKF